MILVKELGIVDMGTYKVKKAIYACPKCGTEKALICSQVDRGKVELSVESTILLATNSKINQSQNF